MAPGVSGAPVPPSDFVIRYCVHDNFTLNPSDSTSWFLFIYSNGTATYRWERGQAFQDSSAHLSAALVSEAHDALTHEGLLSMTGWHNDTGYSDWGCNHTERVCLEISGVQHVVTFGGHSLMGIMPGSFALLNNLMSVVSSGSSDLPQTSFILNVSERAAPSAIADISATFTNLGTTDLMDSGLCNVSWPTYVVSRNGSTVFDLQSGVIPYCLMTFEPDKSQAFGPLAWNRTGVGPGEYVAMSNVVVWSWTYANISADAPWLPSDPSNNTNDNPPEEPAGTDRTLYIVVGSVGVAAAVGILALYFVLRRGPGRMGAEEKANVAPEEQKDGDKKE